MIFLHCLQNKNQQFSGDEDEQELQQEQEI
jgi:hypothetical protein